MSPLSKLPTRCLGRNGPQVTRLGLGLMGNSKFYGLPAPDADRFALLDQAYAQGETFWDTGKPSSSETIAEPELTRTSRHVWRF
jgi:aryl-alcohol dehydrogenase-like predicted oxidoreductase